MNIAILEDEYIHTYRLTEIISTILKDAVCKIKLEK